MKGGITSGVVYPTAISEFGMRYRLRGIGGASAGAIGAAAAAAAEFGRAGGGFEKLEMLPAELGNGRLGTLFQAQPETEPLFRLMVAATESDPSGRKPSTIGVIFRMLATLVASFPLASLVGVIPGLTLVVIGAITGGLAGWLLVVAGLLLIPVGWAAFVAARLITKFTTDVPANLFGICRGLGTSPGEPGFTDWLSDKIDEIAGLPAEAAPLRFGQLWTASKDIPGEVVLPEADDAQLRRIDLRMITTCLSEGRPFEMPWDVRVFFFDPKVWRTLFPESVVQALERAPNAEPVDPRDAEEWRWEETLGAAHDPRLVRLPEAQHLPVIVATRLSLSFPLLISAVPLWSIDRRHPESRTATKRFRAAKEAGTTPPTSGLQFAQEWFTDGGFCSNFPVHLFDAALSSRPTFAINLGQFPPNCEPDPDQLNNVEWARSNRDGLLPRTIRIPSSGFAAIGAFASAAINTARNWQDSSHLDYPGFRDRIVRVLQTKSEGGMNLNMGTEAITGLAERGRTAARAMIDQFDTPHYHKKNGKMTATGWDNHRWVRYRAMMSVLPDWVRSYQRGRDALGGIDPMDPPSYRFSSEGRELANRLDDALAGMAKAIADAGQDAVENLRDKPRPRGILRRIPRT
jgi:predicted acylesterase/phospholipase RssA